MSKITVIIPAYNEEKRIDVTLEQYVSFFSQKPDFSLDHTPGKYNLNLVVVDDGSTDATWPRLERFAQTHKINTQFLHYPQNRGKGFALRHAVATVDPSDLYYFADADLSASWDVLPQLLRELGDFKAVVASRATTDARVETSWHKFLFGRLSALLIQLLLGLRIKDTQCGYKLFGAEVYRLMPLLRQERWGFDFELLYLYKLASLKVKEVGIVWHNQKGSKVKFKDYFEQLPWLVKIRSLHSDAEVKEVLAAQ